MAYVSRSPCEGEKELREEEQMKEAMQMIDVKHSSIDQQQLTRLPFCGDGNEGEANVEEGG